MSLYGNKQTKQLYYTLRSLGLGSTGTIYSVKSDWLTAQCEVSLSTQMLSDTLRGTSLTITFLQQITVGSNLCTWVLGEME